MSENNNESIEGQDLGLKGADAPNKSGGCGCGGCGCGGKGQAEERQVADADVAEPETDEVPNE